MHNHLVPFLLLVALPALYFAANAAIGVAMLIGSPFECLVGTGLLALGVPFYLLFDRANRRRA